MNKSHRQKFNIEKITLKNKNYRKILYTTHELQVVIMSLLPLEEIGMEVHPHTTQFIRIEKGRGKAFVNGKNYLLKSGDVVIIPANTEHNIINTSTTSRLQLYTIYSPPHHPVDKIEKYKT